MASPEIVTRKRKLRKGAHSCWECKRRKARCVFATTQDVCVGCQRRGTKCVSQTDEDLNFGELDHGTIASSRRLQRVEAMLEVLVNGRSSRAVDEAIHGTTSERLITETTRLRSEENPLMLDSEDVSAPRGHGEPRTLSETLHSLLPSREEIQTLCVSQGYVPCFFQQAVMRSYAELSASRNISQTCAETAYVPPPSAPPILIARKLLMLACVIQHPMKGLERSIWMAKADQMASAAIDLVTTKDDLICNAEGLECMILEVNYHTSQGNIRKAFGTTRRAMTIAYILGIHRPFHHKPVRQLDERTRKFDPCYMWHRIVYTDRLLCLILGLPQGAPDIAYPDSACTKEPGEEALEKAHCIIASRILQRNQQDIDDWSVTDSIDEYTKATASSLPPNWWLTPSLSGIECPSEMFATTVRLVSQVLHFNLINQNFLPYILKPELSDTDAARYSRSRDACAAVSREILHRYLAIQSSGLVAHVCHFVDLFTLVAAITLLLVHLHHTWRPPAQHILPHMRSSDRAMIELALGHMSKKAVSKAPQILEQLLAIEEEAFTNHSVGSGRIVKCHADDRAYFELRIPYCGELRVSSVKICFTRNLEIEEVRSGIGLQSEPVSGLEELVDSSDPLLWQDWFSANVQPEIGGEAYGGIENAFLDTFQGFLEETPGS